MIERIGILGAGAWGTALALVAARAGRTVTLCSHAVQHVEDMNRFHENRRNLPGIVFDAPVTATTDEERMLDEVDALVLAVSAQGVGFEIARMRSAYRQDLPVVVAAKGFDRDSGMRLAQVVADTLPQVRPAVLSGPSFAVDVARGLPTAVTIAAEDEELALELCRAFSHAAFRPYAETDIIGVEIGGAVKNVLAIAAGIVAGRQLGASAVAALVARGFAELRRLGAALGARPDTLMGLSGLGDLVLTCSSPQSRNFAYGKAIGEGTSTVAPQALIERIRSNAIGGADLHHPLVEGVATAAVARDLASLYRVEMPIVEAVAAIVDGTLEVDAAIAGLMSRPLKFEGG
jgi:glycerol-3-phosphate dehydrogenase (NAD(P)+)